MTAVSASLQHVACMRQIPTRSGIVLSDRCECLQYERLAGSAVPGAVVIAPLLDTRDILLVREYAVGLERYELGLPMGLLHGSETALQAANRELMEETGYAASNLRRLHTRVPTKDAECIEYQTVAHESRSGQQGMVVNFDILVDSINPGG
jgi:8-oxo-dGTP pyrophosphatase MutT (NUDIX family)